MAVWFEGDIEIACSISDVKDAVANLGEYYVGVVSLMPGMTSVDVIEANSDFVTIKTNEGVMKRTNIVKRIDAESVAVEFDEEYQAGRLVTTKAHFLDEFTASSAGVTYRTVMTEMKAPGLLGFFYRRFGKSRMGNAFLRSQKSYLEKQRQ